MNETKAYNIRMTKEQAWALETLANELGVEGQRGTHLQALIHYIAELGRWRPAETAAALKEVREK